MSSPFSDLPPEALESIVNRKAASIFIIMNKSRTAILTNPATKQPYHCTNRKMAEATARDSEPGSFVCTLQEAFEHFRKNLLT